MDKIKQAVILCAGKGVRMGAKFRDFQKCALPIKGSPLIFQSVVSLISAGIEEVILLTEHKSEQIESCFSKTQYRKYVKYIFCGDPYEAPLNTISTLKNAEGFVDGPFLCVHGDILFHSTIVVELYRSFQNSYTYLGISISGRKYVAPTHARVEHDEKCVVQSIKDSSASDMDVWMGVDVCSPDLINKYCGNAQTSQGDLAKRILDHGEKVVAVPYLYPWTHIVTGNGFLPISLNKTLFKIQIPTPIGSKKFLIKYCFQYHHFE